MQDIQLKIFCLSEALKYIGNTNKGVNNVIEVARTFEDYLTRADCAMEPPSPHPSAPSGDNVLQFPGVH